jgi:hypothetical protein
MKDSVGMEFALYCIGISFQVVDLVVKAKRTHPLVLIWVTLGISN